MHSKHVKRPEKDISGYKYVSLYTLWSLLLAVGGDNAALSQCVMNHV